MHTAMIEVKAYQDNAGHTPYAEWLVGLTDNKTKARIVVRVNRLAAGNFGDCKPLRDGVQELRVDVGPGYRVYLSRQGPVLVLLLCGGDKGDQSRDIERAIAYLKDWKQRGKP
jgi:putative addiction module killer protein